MAGIYSNDEGPAVTDDVYICLVCCCALRGPYQVCGNRCYDRLVAV